MELYRDFEEELQKSYNKRNYTWFIKELGKL